MTTTSEPTAADCGVAAGGLGQARACSQWRSRSQPEDRQKPKTNQVPCTAENMNPAIIYTASHINVKERQTMPPAYFL